MSESQREQYQAISECLAGFRSGTVRLGDLVERLPELLKAVNDPDPVWRENYVEYWWTLEQIHGQAVELGESTRMPPEARTSVDDTIARLDKLVKEALGN